VKDGGTIGWLSHGEWVKFAAVDFGTGVSSVQVKLALPGEYAGRRVEFRTGSPFGPLAGTLLTAGTGGWNTYATQSATVSGLSGVKDLYAVFKGGNSIGNFDSFTFSAGTTGAVRNARTAIQAETLDNMAGVLRSSWNVGMIDDGDWVRYGRVDFGTGVSRFEARLAVAEGYAGGEIEIRLGGATGKKLGTLTTEGTGGWATYETQSTAVAGGAWGVQDVYLIFKGGSGVGNIDWVKFA
jgi:hypothetical protein